MEKSVPELNTPHAVHQVNITLLGQPYQVPCPPEEQTLLLEAVGLLNAQLEAARNRSKVVSKERATLMVAVNLAADLQRTRQALRAREAELDRVEQRLQQLVDRAGGAE